MSSIHGEAFFPPIFKINFPSLNQPLFFIFKFLFGLGSYCCLCPFSLLVWSYLANETLEIFI